MGSGSRSGTQTRALRLERPSGGLLEVAFRQAKRSESPRTAPKTDADDSHPTVHEKYIDRLRVRIGVIVRQGRGIESSRSTRPRLAPATTALARSEDTSLQRRLQLGRVHHVRVACDGSVVPPQIGAPGIRSVASAVRCRMTALVVRT